MGRRPNNELESGDPCTDTDTGTGLIVGLVRLETTAAAIRKGRSHNCRLAGHANGMPNVSESESESASASESVSATEAGTRRTSRGMRLGERQEYR